MTAWGRRGSLRNLHFFCNNRNGFVFIIKAVNDLTAFFLQKSDFSAEPTELLFRFLESIVFPIRNLHSVDRNPFMLLSG